MTNISEPPTPDRVNMKRENFSYCFGWKYSWECGIQWVDLRNGHKMVILATIEIWHLGKCCLNKGSSNIYLLKSKAEKVWIKRITELNECFKDQSKWNLLAQIEVVHCHLKREMSSCTRKTFLRCSCNLTFLPTFTPWTLFSYLGLIRLMQVDITG